MKKQLIYILNLIALVFLGLHSPKIMAEYSEKTETAEKSSELAPDQLPEIVNQLVPSYPEDARKAGLECSILIKALVSEEGKVKEATILSCSLPEFGFEEAAIRAALGSKYKPARLKEKPVSAWISYKILFKLDETT